jgi:hypothetical protein
MRCMACGAEMILTNAVQDETMAVPGFEHHTFMCSECQDIERRFVFMKQDRNSDTEGMPEQVAPPVVPASTVQDEPVTASDLVTGPMEQGEIVPLQPTQTAPVALTQTAPVDEPTVMVELSQTDAPVSTPETRAWAKAFGEKLRKLTARATGLREAVGETERRAQFNHVWVNLLSAPEGLGQVGPPTRASVSDHIPQLGESDPRS